MLIINFNPIIFDYLYINGIIYPTFGESARTLKTRGGICMCGGFNVPMGIPIPGYLHEQLPEDTQRAFEIFDAWFKNQDPPRRRADMPDDVAKALVTIKGTPIPGYEPRTCAESCYVIGVERMLVE